MVKMPADVIETIKKQNPVPIATSSAGGIPNVAFMGFLKILDDETILIADNFFKKTKSNINENPKLAIVAYDGETKKSYQVKGSVELITSGRIYDETVEWVQSMRPGMLPKSAAVFHVEEVYDSRPGPTAGDKIL